MYLNHFKLEIFESYDEEYPNRKDVIGKADFYQISISACVEDRFPLEVLFDTTESISDLADAIFNFSKNDINDELEASFEGNFGVDICFLEKIELLPEYRNIGLAQKLTQVANVVPKYLLIGLFNFKEEPIVGLIFEL